MVYTLFQIKYGMHYLNLCITHYITGLLININCHTRKHNGVFTSTILTKLPENVLTFKLHSLWCSVSKVNSFIPLNIGSISLDKIADNKNKLKRLPCGRSWVRYFILYYAKLLYNLFLPHHRKYSDQCNGVYWKIWLQYDDNSFCGNSIPVFDSGFYSTKGMIVIYLF